MKKKIALKTILLATSFVFILGSCSKKNKENNDDKTSTVITSSDDITSGNTTTSGNVNTSTTSGSGNTSTTTTDDVIDYSLDANQFYISNDNNMIIKSFENDNKLETLTLFTKYGQGVYIKPLIENNKFKALAILDTEDIDDDNLVSKYVGISSGYSKIFDFAVDSLSDKTYVTKPLKVKLSENNIEINLLDKIYNFNIEGKIDEDASLNLTNNNEFDINHNILKFNSNGLYVSSPEYDFISIKIEANDFKYDDGQKIKKISFKNNKFIKQYDNDFHSMPFNLSVTLNDDFTANAMNISYDTFMNFSYTYEYSEDKKTITEIVNNSQGGKEVSFGDDIGLSATPSDKPATSVKYNVYEFDDNYNLNKITYNYNGKTYTTLYTYNDDLTISEILKNEDNEENFEKFTYDKSNNLIKYETGSVVNGSFNVENKTEYLYDNNNKLIQMDYYDKGNHSFTYLEVSEKSKYTFAALRYNGDLISYENSDKEETTYDDNGNIIEKIIYDSSFTNIHKKYVYTYSSDDTYDSIIEIVEKYNNNGFTNGKKYVIRYNDNLNTNEIYNYDDYSKEFVLIAETKKYTEDGYEIVEDNTYNNSTGENLLERQKINKTKDDYNFNSEILFVDGEAYSGEKTESTKEYVKKYTYNNVKKDFLMTYDITKFDNIDDEYICKIYKSYQYDENGDLVYYCYENNKLSKDYETLTLSEISIYYDQGNISEKYMTDHTYDDNDRLIKAENKQYYYDDLEGYSIFEYKYDGDSDTRSEETYKEYDENENLIKTSYSLRINNQMVKVYEKQLINNELKDTYLLTLNDDDNTTNKIEKYYYSSDAYYLYRYIVENYDHGTPTTKEDHYYNNENTETSKETYEYINGDYRIKGRYANKSTNIFKGLLITVNYDYDENGNNIKYQMYSYYDDSITVNYYEKVDGYSSLQNQSYEKTYYNSEAVATSSEVFVKVGENSFACTEKYTIIDGIKYLIDKKIYQENSSYYLAWFECDFDAENKFYNYILEKDYDDDRNTINVYRYQNKKDSNTHQIYQLKSNYLNSSYTWTCDVADIGNYYNIIELAAEALTFEDVVEIYNNRNNKE